MKADYHRQITTTALEAQISPRALGAIVHANLGQDSLAGLLFHPEFHFDDNRFAASETYLTAQRHLASTAVEQGDLALAWSAFGRLTHAAQDYYAHSNYVQLYREAYPHSLAPEIDPLAPEILKDPRLNSGTVHWGWELIQYFLPGLGFRLSRRIPANTHAGMNLDHPGRGALFPFALQAAVFRTRSEFQALLEPLADPDRRRFCDRTG